MRKTRIITHSQIQQRNFIEPHYGVSYQALLDIAYRYYIRTINKIWREAI